MKICITAHGETLESPIDERFGRAEIFLLIDTETMKIDALSNTKGQDSHGVGIASGSLIAKAGAAALLTGHCGPKALEVLSAAGIRVYNGAHGTVKETLDAFLREELSEATAPGTPR